MLYYSIVKLISFVTKFPAPDIYLSLDALSYETRFRWISSEFWTRRRENLEAYLENRSRSFPKAAVKIQKKGAALEFRNSKLKELWFAWLFNTTRSSFVMRGL